MPTVKYSAGSLMLLAYFILLEANDLKKNSAFFGMKRINNQPPLHIFTKGANISGGHCI